jgi:hypothetical protein
MNWRCGSSNRVPALQVQSPDFKPQSHQKKKKKELLMTWVAKDGSELLQRQWSSLNFQ